VSGDTALVASANVELVRSMYAGWERGDFDSATWAHPEIEFVFADGPSPGRWSGLSGMADAIRDWLQVWEDLRQIPEEYRELDGHRVLGLHYFAARGKKSGLEVGNVRREAAAVYTIRDGKVFRIVHYFDRHRALADLGLPKEDHR
jgi:ketosteroid isomerase-like protein